jgi:recombination protein RecA
MREKRKGREEPKNESNYFASEQRIEFISTGCQVLDCTLGGGVAESRVLNIVGNKSSGKTLLAIEISANFYQKYGDSADIVYHETEAAFDKPYAHALGMPVEAIDFVGEDDDSNDKTVEYWYEKLSDKLEELKKTKRKCLWVTDSLDALSDRAELERAIDAGSYGTQKAAKMSEFFRRLNSKMSEADITLIIVSQIRDKIGATYGKKTTRSGGKALDFYASQVIWITEIGKLTKTFRKVKRKYGVKVKANCEKNKVGLPYRECEYPIIFGYGIDDAQASLDFLASVDALEDSETFCEVFDELEAEAKKKKKKGKIDSKQVVATIVKRVQEGDDREALDEINEKTKAVWKEVEIGFLPKGKKY